ncbi:MAG TPA: DNA-protecting protein DprA [Candidatus Moranbacteria bacterium]|nr:DNA-protecting protein DprA [Candidatus Moranbacteria bacterium]HBT46242.1 DNA-protecting protein DprA [Candidatus Moranbacteria bacterium]
MKHLNALNTIYGLGNQKMKLLMSFFESAEQVWQASREQLLKSGIAENIAQKIVEQRPLIDVEKEWEKLERENILAIGLDDPRYPALLKQIPDNPYVIYMKGDLKCLDLPLVAIVGSRKLTEYGNDVARGFARDLADSGICVVSGLAFGVDAMAHTGALEVKGRTIAVLGNSLDSESIAPRTNFQLSEDIIKGGGLLVSEFPVKTAANVGTFPARNRIMAGMSLGTLVVEAAEKSGSLITANLALDYNRDVFAVPGSIFSPQSTGTHMLIKAGAKLVTCVGDILTELRIESGKKMPLEAKVFDLTDDEKIVHTVLSHESLHIDRISKLTKLETSTISSILAMMEIKGAIKNVGGQNYIRL